MTLPPTGSELKVGERTIELFEEHQVGRGKDDDAIVIPHGDLNVLRAIITEQVGRFEEFSEITDVDDEPVERSAWIVGNVRRFWEDLTDPNVISQWGELNPQYKGSLKKAFEGAEIDTEGGQAFFGYYLSYVTFKHCGKCHAIEGDLPFGDDASPRQPLSISRTGITPVARRWYPNSVFDHYAHRMMTCLECHPHSPSSRLTSDVLVPDIQNCVSCHRTNAQLAPANCVTCHTYHDRSKERPPIGPLAAPTTQPVTAAK